MSDTDRDFRDHEKRSVARTDFRHLCDLADVKGLRVGLTAGTRHGNGYEAWRELDAITLSYPNSNEGQIRERIHLDVDSAARRLLEVIR